MSMKIKYYSYFSSLTGHGLAARSIAHSFQTVGVDIRLINIVQEGVEAAPTDFFNSFTLLPPHSNWHSDCNIFFGMPWDFSHLISGNTPSIIITTTEVSGLDSRFKRELDRYNRIWVPSVYNKKVLSQYPSLECKTDVFPHCLPPDIGKPKTNYSIPNIESYGKPFTILSIGDWIKRKGFDILLTAFARAFTERDNVRLVLKLSSSHHKMTASQVIEEAQQLINKVSVSEGCAYLQGRVSLICRCLSSPQIAELYRSADAFCCPSRSEGWGCCHFEAMAYGLPVIGTDYSGVLEFMNPTNSYLIHTNGTELLSKDNCDVERYYGYRWAIPSTTHLVKILQSVFFNYDAAVVKGRLAAAHVRSEFSAQQIGIAGTRLACNLIDSQAPK